MNPLAVEPSDEQMRLLEVVYKGRQLAGGPHYYPAGWQSMQQVGREPDAWPVFQYVEAVLHRKHDLDARTLIAELPTIRFGVGQGHYSWVQPDSRDIPQAETKIRLSIAGMTKVQAAAAEVDVFIETLALLVERQRRFVPDATKVVSVEVWSGEIKEKLKERWDLQIDDKLTAVRTLIGAEPSTWHCQPHDEEQGAWRLVLSPFVTRFAEVANAGGYVERLAEVLTPPAVEPPPTYVSALALPEAIDYLNAVWRAGLGAGAPLIRISRAEAAAKLALECSTVDELESRLSGLVGLLGQLRLPGVDGDQPLIDLEKYLAQRLSSAGAERTKAAITVLRDVIAIRNWRQHPGMDAKGLKAAARLGIQLPSSDWSSTWDAIRAEVVVALSAIREELEQPASRVG